MTHQSQAMRRLRSPWHSKMPETDEDKKMAEDARRALGELTGAEVECPICHKPAEPVHLRDGTTCSPRQFVDKYGMCAACYKEKRTTGEKA